ncbi:MAG: patatin-like phospholipase family protein [Anaerolineales bacterium]|nr:patatin-like phospholipase family protein [Anaerolineales bacterium]
MLPKSRKRALVLSGGGGRGAFHVGALKFLQEHEWFPDIVVGTSIGAVNGAAIASGHDARSLWSLWKRLRTADVQEPNIKGLQDGYLLDTSPLAKTLEREGWLDTARINSEDAAVHLRITATEVDTGKLQVFGNSPDMRSKGATQERIEIKHIISSCSIPLVYPATKMNKHMYWDGATVSNTPLSAAIDAGAEEIVVVLMTPWGDESEAVKMPESLLEAAGLALDWALLGSFRSDLKMFYQVNELVRMQAENIRLRTMIAELYSRMGDTSAAEQYADRNHDGIPDIFEKQLRDLPNPIIIAPEQPIPALRIVSYTPDGHEDMYQQGYKAAKAAWRGAGRKVEGEPRPPRQQK